MSGTPGDKTYAKRQRLLRLQQRKLWVAVAAGESNPQKRKRGQFVRKKRIWFSSSC
jgi:hypothetical protein